MANYKNAEGVVYKESDLRGWADKRGMNFDDYIKKAGLSFDKIDYDDATIGQKFLDLGAKTASGIVGFAEGLSDYKDGIIYTLSTIGEGEQSKEAKEAAMIAIKDTYGGDPFEKLMQGLDEQTLEFDEASITETFKEDGFVEGGFRAMGAGLQSIPSIRRV